MLSFVKIVAGSAAHNKGALDQTETRWNFLRIGALAASTCRRKFQTTPESRYRLQRLIQRSFRLRILPGPERLYFTRNQRTTIEQAAASGDADRYHHLVQVGPESES